MSKSVSGYYKTKHWCREGKTLVVRPLKKTLSFYVCLPLVSREGVKKDDFFQTKFQKYSACPEKPFALKQFFGFVSPSLSTGSNAISIKKEKKLDF